MKNIYFFILALITFTSFSFGQSKSKASFFPIAVWLQSPENAIRYHQDGGINLYIGLWRELDEQQFDLLKRAGIQLICEQNAFGLAHKAEPTIYGWMSGDEPDNAQWN
ncbi:MAG TPA: hypothetical protein DCL77_05835, partial [Prolixibacteraceae bacterium]|nr:hypothetical protein [Prolixibacteraceae bacterium]